MKRSTLLANLTAIAAITLALGCTTPADDGQTPTETTEYVADKMNDRIVRLDSEGNTTGFNEFVTRPTDISLYPGVNALWVADYSGDRVVRLDLDLGFAAATEEGLLNDPIAVSVTADGECWVADRVNHAFVRLDSEAHELGRVTVDGPTRCVAWDEANGYCWCADESGNLYAFDGGLTGDGSEADARVTFTGLGVIRGLAVDPDGDRVWVGDSDGGRVLCLDSDGGVSFTATYLLDPQGLSLDSNGDCWVAVRGDGSALLLDSEDGAVLEDWGGLNGPVDVCAEPGGGVWVVEETGNKVKLIRDGDTVATAEGFSSPAAVVVYDPELW
ncbi:MAG: NHL repeat-containing protein [bacterium]|nr:NHL repeat-containing protein [bacterium]